MARATELTVHYREKIQTWLFQDALPWWAEHGLDHRDGGYVEQMTLSGRDAGGDFKRTRVTCRQMYVFSHAHILGWQGDGAGLAQHGFDFLTRNCWKGETDGFVRRTTRNGETLDATPDLYDLAFALFAFSWFHRATGYQTARDWMHRTADFIESHMRHPDGEGFLHERPAKGLRLQNPHMHLTEAALAAFETTGEARFRALALELSELFRTRFFDAATSTLRENFTDRLAPAPGEAGNFCEPGHQFEWAWILNRCRTTLNVDYAAEIRAAIGFASRYGVDPATGLTRNTLLIDGSVLDGGSRCWPNTERLKAAVALYELDGVDPAPVFEQTLQVLFGRYLDHRPAGTWQDAFDAQGKPLAHIIPASTFYHIFLAFAEVLRVCEADGLA